MNPLFKSIRWRLQAWHALIQILVLGGFGGTAYLLERENRFHRIDQELQQHAASLSEAFPMFGPPPPFLKPPQKNHPTPHDDFPHPDFPSENPLPQRRENRAERRPDKGPGPGPDPRFHDRFEPRLRPEQETLFSQSGPGFTYFSIWNPQGSQIKTSTNAPPNIPPPQPSQLDEAEPGRTRGSLREFAHTTRRGWSILVGRDISTDLAELQRRAWILATAGGAILTLGLCGGWLLATRAIKPITEISSTASRIANGNLNERIKPTETFSELGQLATILNKSFDRLQTALARQSQLTADASHELRTPVTVLLTQIQASLARERSAQEYKDTLNACQRTAQRMRHLISALLELARLDAQQESFEPTPFNLATTARECTELLRPLAAQKQINLITHLTPTPCHGDPSHIAQVITNLITNAIQYNRDHGTITITVQPAQTQAQLTVADSGIGIEPADLPKIFDRFYRADKARSSTSGQTGLGLAITKAILDAHNGSISASSTPGSGTTFTVLLPSTPS